MAKETYYVLDGDQLTCYTVDRNILISCIVPVMQHLIDQYSVQGWKGIIDATEAAVHAVTEFTLVRVGSGWLGYTVGKPWFLDREILMEEFIYDVPLEIAIPLLRKMAEEEGASRMVIGTRAAPGGRHMGLAKTYSKLGLEISTIELSLEIGNEQSGEESNEVGQEGRDQDHQDL